MKIELIYGGEAWGVPPELGGDEGVGQWECSEQEWKEAPGAYLPDLRRVQATWWYLSIQIISRLYLCIYLNKNVSEVIKIEFFI